MGISLSCDSSDDASVVQPTTTKQPTELKAQERSLLIRTGLCIGIIVFCVMYIIYLIYTYDVQVINNDGWVLYYSTNCPHCKTLQENLNPVIWFAMEKRNCADPLVTCHEDITTVPTWRNKYTGQLWDGVGSFR